MARLDLFLFLFLLFVFALSESEKCYFLNGDEDSDGAICWDRTGRATGLCCQSGHLCLNNTLCAKRDGSFFYRGSCLDKEWRNSACPYVCDLWVPGGIEEVYACSRDFTRWGCWHSVKNCNEGPVFKIGQDTSAYATAGVRTKPKPVPDPGSTSRDETSTSTPRSSTTKAESIKQTSSDILSSDTSSMSTTSTTSTASTSESATTASEPVTVASEPVTTASEPAPTEFASAAASSTSSSSELIVSSTSTATPSSASQGSGSSNAALPIGVGVGIGASVVIATGVIGFLYLRKRKREAPRRAESPPPFEFAAVGNPARVWPGPAQEPKLPVVQANNRNMPELGGVQRFELP